MIGDIQPTEVEFSVDTFMRAVRIYWRFPSNWGVLVSAGREAGELKSTSVWTLYWRNSTEPTHNFSYSEFIYDTTPDVIDQRVLDVSRR